MLQMMPNVQPSVRASSAVSPGGEKAKGSLEASARMPAAVASASVWWSLGSNRSRTGGLPNPFNAKFNSARLRSFLPLMTALRNRVATEGWHEELLEEVVDILDDAAQRIERAKKAKRVDPEDDEDPEGDDE